MAQHDLNIANGSGAAVRADLNGALEALGSCMKGANAPTAPLPGMIWVEDDNPSATEWSVRQYDGSDWITLGILDATNNRFTPSGLFAAGTSGAPGFAPAGDSDTGLWAPAANTLAVSTNAVERVRVTSAGLVGIGTSSPSATLHVAGNARLDSTYPAVNFYPSTGTSNQRSFKLEAGDGEAYFISINDSGSAVSYPFYMQHAGTVTFPGTATTASAANAFLDGAAGNKLFRSTSSRRYKRNIEDIDPQLADAVLSLRPVWYRSNAGNDRQDWSWYGLIAEEVAEVDPRLVHFAYAPEDMQSQRGGPPVPREGAQKVPDAVQYDRLSVLLLDVVKRQRDCIGALEARIAALETARA